MLLNRVLLLIMIIITGIFASFYGGNISYALFYMFLLLPLISFLYTLYVFAQFKMGQSVGKRTVVKGEITEFTFLLCNEDIIPYQNIRVNFYHDKSKILDADKIKDYSLLPGEKQCLETSICCNYRGEYYVGAETVTITDFLYLFSITYSVVTKMKLVVLPRIVSLNNIKIISANADSKGRINHFKNEEEEVDLEVRKYVSGDNKKLIHWKTSAKKNELFTRKSISIPKTSVTIFMDLCPVNEEDLYTTIVEDKIIESAIAMVDYFKRKHISCEICFEQEGIQNISIQNQGDFNLLYHKFACIHFVAQKRVEELIIKGIEVHNRISQNGLHQYIVITHFITQELYKAVLKIVSSGNECGIIFVNQYLSSEMDYLLRSIRKAGVNITIINNNDEIEKLL